MSKINLNNLTNIIMKASCGYDKSYTREVTLFCNKQFSEDLEESVIYKQIRYTYPDYSDENLEYKISGITMRVEVDESFDIPVILYKSEKHEALQEN